MKNQNKYTPGEIMIKGEDYFYVAPGVWGMKVLFVNVYIVEIQADQWFLVDSGLQGSADKIIRMAESIFHKGTKPMAIVLTHAHFDHVGALDELLKKWNVPVYAHPLEIPYLEGMSSYPPPDPLVGGGLMSLMSWTFPRSPIDLGPKVIPMHADGIIPGMDGWTFFETPGHAPGQVSFFREEDRVLIAGDAFVTTDQQSLYSVVTQKKELNGPPKYFTINWNDAHRSVQLIAHLHPNVAATGHGKPMFGKELRHGLARLTRHFQDLAVPRHGRYVDDPALADESGIIYVPDSKVSPELVGVITLLAGMAALAIIWAIKPGRSSINKSGGLE